MLRLVHYCLFLGMALLLYASAAVTHAHELPVYSLTINKNDLNALNGNPYVDTYYPADFSGEGLTSSCEVRFRGATSRGNPKKSWKIKFPDKKNVFETDTLNLNANYDDESMMRNGLTMQLFRYLGYPSSRTRYVNLTVNGVEYGLFQVVENIDKSFLKFNDRKSGSLYKCITHDANLSPLVEYQDYPLVYEKNMGDEHDYSDLQLFLNKIFYWSDEDFMANIEETVNVDNILNYYAVMFSIVSLDCMTKNYYLFNNPQTGKWELFPWDNDAAYGIDWQGTYYDNASAFIEGTYLDFSVLFQRLMENEKYRADYSAKIEKIRTEGFSYLHTQIDSTYSLIKNDYYLDKSRRFTDQEFDTAITRLHSFLNDRAPFLTDRTYFNRKTVDAFYCSNPYPGESNPTVKFRATLSSAGTVSVVYSTDLDYSVLGDDYTLSTLKLLDDGLHDDGAAGDLVYGNSMQMPSGSNAYIPFAFYRMDSGFTPANGLFRANYYDSNTCILNTMNPDADVFQSLVIKGVVNTNNTYAIELANTSDRQLDISFCHIRGCKYYYDYIIPKGTVIKGNDKVIITSDSTMAQAVYPGKTILSGLWYAIAEGDSLSLLSPVYSPIQSFLCSRYLNHEANNSNVVITEINYNSASQFDPGDWVELYNPGKTSTDISGWTLTDDKADHVFSIPSNTFIKPNGYYVICADSTLFGALFPEVTAWCGNMGFGLGSNGDSVNLYDPQGLLVDTVTYTNDAPWPQTSDGNGATLTLESPLSDNSLPESWRISATLYGTPGSGNTIVGVHETPTAFVLKQNYPNPFNISTTIPFELQKRCKAKITVYTIDGQFVARLHDGYLDAGNHSISFNANKLSSGLYFYRIQTENVAETKQMILLK